MPGDRCQRCAQGDLAVAHHRTLSNAPTQVMPQGCKGPLPLIEQRGGPRSLRACGRSLHSHGQSQRLGRVGSMGDRSREAGVLPSPTRASQPRGAESFLRQLTRSQLDSSACWLQEMRRPTFVRGEEFGVGRPNPANAWRAPHLRSFPNNSQGRGSLLSKLFD